MERAFEEVVGAQHNNRNKVIPSSLNIDSRQLQDITEAQNENQRREVGNL